MTRPFRPLFTRSHADRPSSHAARAIIRSPSDDDPTGDEQALWLAAEQARCRRLLAFTELAWPIIEPATPLLLNWHLEAICEHLEAVARGDVRRLLINLPPRCGKSIVVCVMFGAWMWAIRNPACRFLYSSYDHGLATRDSLATRRLIECSWYQTLWGDQFRLTGDQNVKTRFENDRTGVRLSTTVRGAATGEGGDVIICDDPHSILRAESDADRREVIRWWAETMSTRVNDPRTAAFVIIGQRAHHQDLSGYVLAQGGYEHLCLPMEYEGSRVVLPSTIGFRDPRNREGELLWPERFGPPEITELKRSLGSHAYAGQFQQRPTPREGGIIKREWLQFYQALPDPLTVEAPEPVLDAHTRSEQMRGVVVSSPRRSGAVSVQWIQSWDLSFKDTQAASHTVGQVWLRVGPNFYLVDQVRAIMGFVDSLDAIRRLTDRYPQTTAKYIEGKANGPAIMDVLKREIPGLIEIEPRGAKPARLEAVSPLFRSGNVWLPDPQRSGFAWVHEYVDELTTAPACLHWDQCDATSQALDQLNQALHKKPLQMWVYSWPMPPDPNDLGGLWR
jgi:predicted phage terminase large subunit-like protein